MDTQIKFREKVGYGLGDAASSMFWKLFGSYLLFFYTDIFGLPAAAVGTMFLITRFWDSFVDPVVGILADRTQSRRGKFRPYLLWFAVPFGMAGVLTFTTPGFGMAGKLVYAYITYGVMMMIYSLINVPYASLLGVISDNPKSRTALSSYRMIFAFGGSILALLTIEPLLGALAGGNCCILKPSKDAPATSAIIRQICAECFPLEEVAVVEGGRTENQALLDQPFDKIFFTGSSHVGQEVLRRAAEHLTPATLELGGKSPVIVAKDAALPLAARRIAFGKLLNAGQTCVAPDYVLVAREVEDAFVAALQKQFDQLCPDPLHSAEYVHIVNQKHFDRLTGLMASGQIVYGGSIDPAALRIAPTILRNVSPDSPVMQEEIFGPILPILPVSSIDEAVAFAAARPHPLACYLFTKDRAVQRRVLDTLPFGGGCINDTIIHLATSRMPFGGVGHSGMGGYHGRDSFRCFTHDKSIVKKALWLDLPMRYTPYSKKKETLIRFFLK